MVRNWLFRTVLVAAVLAAWTGSTLHADPRAPINKPGLVLEYDRAIFTLQRGIALNWETSDRYLEAFSHMRRTGTSGESLTVEYAMARALMQSEFSIIPRKRIWDEQFPVPPAQRFRSVMAALESARQQLLIADFGDASSDPQPAAYPQ
jgi:hypothetical protein